MAGPDWKSRSIDQIVDLTKQIITLSTAVLTLTVSLFGAFLPKNAAGNLIAPAGGAEGKLIFSWIVFVISIVFGILTLSKLASDQAAQDGAAAAHQKSANQILYAPVTVIFALVQWGLFALGLALQVWAVHNAF